MLHAMIDPIGIAIFAKAPIAGFAKTRLMPQLGPDDADNGDKGHDADGVCLDMKAPEVQVQDITGADCRQPEHETERTDGERAKMNIWIHARGFIISIASMPIFGGRPGRR